jgi:hypothetical protein
MRGRHGRTWEMRPVSGVRAVSLGGKNRYGVDLPCRMGNGESRIEWQGGFFLPPFSSFSSKFLWKTWRDYHEIQGDRGAGGPDPPLDPPLRMGSQTPSNFGLG